MASRGSSYWCYRCSRFVRVRAEESAAIACPDCGGGFVEEVDSSSRSGRDRLTTAAMYVGERSDLDQNNLNLGFRNNRRRNRGDRSPYNPVIVLPGPGDGVREGGGNERGNFELFYDDGSGSGLRPLPAGMSDFLMGSGFERLLEQLAQLEINGIGRFDQPPASKAAVDSMPTIKIVSSHLVMESHCAVCKEAFELDSEAREMPCKHIYHSECILPWLSMRNSCPVCRHELPSDVRGSVRNSPDTDGDGVQQFSEEETVGLTIWRLPGGGFAVGRFTGGRRAAERELPVVYTEMDGGFNAAGAPRRISWSWTARGSRSRERGRISRAFRSFVSFFGRLRGPSSRSTSSPGDSVRRRLDFSGSSRRRSHPWSLENDSDAEYTR
ncbi:protein of unknown function DUF1117 [Dillenia turbinata]|uniref:RING-type E3 ubiquitin transferase n=1 Tax=Dillenia turbinata TaxID=194707 RepID=A0AAN8ZQG4_9MAGN